MPTVGPTPQVPAEDSSSDEDLPEPAARPEPGEPLGPVTMARANWSSGYVQAQIVHDLLEQVGYDVVSPDTYEFAPDLAYQAIADGSVDLWTNSWYPGHLSWWDIELADGRRAGASLSRLEEPMIRGGGMQGMLVTRSWALDKGFTTLDEINADPDLWQAIDSDGDGLGEIYGCAESWTCDDVINAQIAFAGWDNIEQLVGGYDANFAEFLDKVQAGEPAIIYTWTPTSYIAQAAPGIDTMWLSVNTASVLDDSNPLDSPFGEEFSQYLDGVPGFDGAEHCLIGPDGCQLGWGASDIEITARTEWLEENPVGATLLRQIKLSILDLSDAGYELSWSDGSQSDVEEIAGAWIESHPRLVDEWVTTALAAG